MQNHRPRPRRLNQRVRQYRCSVNFTAPASIRTGPIRCVRSFDPHLEQHRFIGGEYLEKGGVQILTALDTDAFDPLTQAERAEIETGQLDSGQRLDAEAAAEFFERAIARVVDDDEGDRKLELGGAP